MSVGIRTLADKSIECAVGNHDACSDPSCVDYCHMPDRDDAPVWTDGDEATSWLDDDQRAERRADQ